MELNVINIVINKHKFMQFFLMYIIVLMELTVLQLLVTPHL